MNDYLVQSVPNVQIVCYKYRKSIFRLHGNTKAFVSQNLSTPFCENRYHKIADLAEWCFFFCDIFLKYKDLTQVYLISFVFYEKVTAFAYTIRAPPSEI